MTAGFLSERRRLRPQTHVGGEQKQKRALAIGSCHLGARTARSEPLYLRGDAKESSSARDSSARTPESVDVTHENAHLRIEKRRFVSKEMQKHEISNTFYSERCKIYDPRAAASRFRGTFVFVFATHMCWK